MLKYLLDLGFHISVKVPTPAPVPEPPKVKLVRVPMISVREQPKEPPISLKEYEEAVRQRKLHEMSYVIPKEVVKELSLIAEHEVLMATTKLDKELANVLRSLDERGISTKVLLEATDCKGLREIGIMNFKCYLKALGFKLGARLPLALYAWTFVPHVPPDPLYLVLGSVAGLTLVGLASMVGLTVALEPKGLSYTQLPWALKASAITSIVSSFYIEKGKRLENAEVRTIKYIPFNYFIIDGKKAIVTECPLTSDKPCLARVYKEGAYEAAREFKLIWQASLEA